MRFFIFAYTYLYAITFYIKRLTTYLGSSYPRFNVFKGLPKNRIILKPNKFSFDRLGMIGDLVHVVK